MRTRGAKSAQKAAHRIRMAQDREQRAMNQVQDLAVLEAVLASFPQIASFDCESAFRDMCQTTSR
jgi:hypothetical protein